MDLFAYSAAPAQFHDLTNATSCSFPPSYSSFSLSPVCSPASFSPFSHTTKPQLLLLRATQQLLAWSSADAPPPPAASTMALSSGSALCQWALVLVLTALCLSLLLSLLVSAQIVARYTAAYWAAPREIASLLDAADSSLQENESYDRDVVAHVPQREDKIRLGRMLQEIQRASDDLREDLNSVLVGGHGQAYGNTEANGMSTGAAQLVDQKQLVRRKPSQQHIASSTTEYCSSSLSTSPQLRTVARILWAARRIHIEERLRRLDMLRMRFLVIYMSIVAAATTAAAEKAEKSAIIVAAAAVTVSTPVPTPAPVYSPAAAPTTPAPGRASTSSTSTTIATAKRTRTPPAKAAASRTVRLTRATTPALKHISSSTSSEDSSGDDSDSDSGSSACSSPLMSAASMPTSPQPPQKTPASIVAASIAKAAADAIASGDTDGKYHPGSPTSPGWSTPPTIPEVPDTPPGSGRSHSFLRSITEQQQLRSPPATPGPTSPTSDIGGFRRKPTRRVTALGIRPPEASPENNHRAGWMGVVQELQRSPLLQKRHTSIEMSIARQTR